MPGLIVSILISFAIGFLFLELLWPAGALPGTQRAIKACLALPMGHGLTSCSLFVWLLVYGRVSRSYVAIEILMLAVLAAAVFFVGRKRGAPSPSGDKPETVALRYGWLFPAACGIAFISAAVVFIQSIIREPHGLWDGWAIYELHARSIFRGGSNWREGFSPLIWWSHPDYPLLLPLSTVRTWLYAGREIAFAQSIATGLFSFSAVGLLVSGVKVLRSRAQGFLAGTVLLSFGVFIEIGSSAYADVPLLSLITATFILYALHNELQPKGGGFLILAGITAGLAAWTKNEGLLFVVASVLAHALIIFRARGLRVCLRQLGFIVTGLLPVLTIVLYFKIRIAPPSELVASIGAATLKSKLLDYHRYIVIARAFWWELIFYSGRGISLTYLLPIYLLCMGVTSKYKTTVIQLFLTICLMLAGYSWIYLTSPYDLAFHTSTSVGRLLLQLWPSFLFGFFLMAASPEESSTGAIRRARTKTRKSKQVTEQIPA